MEVRSKVTVILNYTENVPEESIKELEKNIEMRVGSKEHRELIEKRLTEILKAELGTYGTVNDVTVTGLETE